MLGISHGAPFPRSARGAGEDEEATWPRQAGDLSGRDAEHAHPTVDCRRSREDLHRQAETLRHGRKVPLHRRMPTRTAPVARWRRWPGLASVWRGPALKIWWRSTLVSGVAASCGRPTTARSPCTRPQEHCPCRKETGNPAMLSIFARPKGLDCQRTGLMCTLWDGQPTPAVAIQGGFACVPRPASLSGEG